MGQGMSDGACLVEDRHRGAHCQLSGHILGGSMDSRAWVRSTPRPVGPLFFAEMPCLAGERGAQGNSGGSTL